MVKKYIPDRGDIIWINLDPSLGHEQKGRRPGFVLSPKSYNKVSGLIVACPITSISKKYPYEVVLGKRGVILTDQIRSLSWQERRVEFITRSSPQIVVEVFNKIKTLFDS